MAPPLSNTFAGGADGVAVTAANSGGGSGDAFNVVAGSSWLYESTDGTFSVQATNPLDADYMEWQALGSITGAVYLRFYVFLSALPTVAHWAAGAYVNAAISAVFAPIVFATDGKVYDGQLAAATTAYSTGQWIRVESRVVPSTTGTGESEYRLYNTAEADVNSYTSRQVRTGLTFSIANIDRYRFMGGAGGANSTVSPRATKVAVSTTDWIGPSTFGFTNTVVPTVTGALTVGGTLTANPGTWTPTPSSFNYYWHRADDAAATNLVEIGATGSTYTLASADLNKYLRAGVIPVA